MIIAAEGLTIDEFANGEDLSPSEPAGAWLAFRWRAASPMDVLQQLWKLPRKSAIIAAAVLIAGNVSAADIQKGLGDINPDLSMRNASTSKFVGSQPRIGDSLSRYHGWDESNSELVR